MFPVHMLFLMNCMVIQHTYGTLFWLYDDKENLQVSITQSKSMAGMMLFHVLQAVDLFSVTPFHTRYITYMPQVQD